MTRIVRMRGIPFSAAEEDIHKFFSTWGLEDVRICKKHGAILTPNSIGLLDWGASSLSRTLAHEFWVCKGSRAQSRLQADQREKHTSNSRRKRDVRKPWARKIKKSSGNDTLSTSVPQKLPTTRACLDYLKFNILPRWCVWFRKRWCASLTCFVRRPEPQHAKLSPFRRPLFYQLCYKNVVDILQIKFISVCCFRFQDEGQWFYPRNLQRRLFKAKDQDLEPRQSEVEILGKGHVVRMRGLPFSACVEDILLFFEHIPSVDQDNVLFVYDSSGRPSGEAYVYFTDEEGCNIALKMDKKEMGSRYIELFPTHDSDIQRASRLGRLRSGKSDAHIGRRPRPNIKSTLPSKSPKPSMPGERSFM